MNRRNNFETRKAQLVEEIDLLRKEYDNSPRGALIINTTKKTPQWIVQKSNAKGEIKRTYIRKENKQIAKRYARKTYIRAVLFDKRNELRCIDRYLKACKEKNFEKYLRIDSPYRELLVDTGWELAPYNKNPNYPEDLIVPTIKGDMVRSKSEALIANELLAYGVPYRYENGLPLGEATYYPDFTVKSQRNQTIVIWEHFGKIDDPDYVHKTSRKLEEYFNYGYVPGVNLLMTFEDKRHPLTVETVRDCIEKYLVL
jgi:hypothetical protein